MLEICSLEGIEGYQVAIDGRKVIAPIDYECMTLVLEKNWT